MLGGGGGGVDWEEGSVEVGQTRAAMRLYPLPFTNPSPQYPGFGFRTVASSSQTVIWPYIGHLYSTAPDVDLALSWIFIVPQPLSKATLGSADLQTSLLFVRD